MTTSTGRWNVEAKHERSLSISVLNNGIEKLKMGIADRIIISCSLTRADSTKIQHLSNLRLYFKRQHK